MFVTITSIKLKSPWHFFPLSYHAMQILKQLKTTPCVSHKTRGIWTDHYTMTLWASEADLKAFAKSGAHLTSMQKSQKIAKEIRTKTYPAEHLPDWKTAKELLKTAKIIQY